jgi:hypothetical protein
MRALSPGMSHLIESVMEETCLIAEGDTQSLKRKVEEQPVGKVFFFNDEYMVKTPFNTLVSSQTYITVLQERVLELTTIPVELEIHELKNEVRHFRSLGFLDLLKLAFKRLLKRK